MDNDKAITDFFRLGSPLPKACLTSLLQAGKPCKMAKGEYFIREGQVCKNFCFIHSGIFSFLILANGEEHVKDFSGPNTFLTAFASFSNQTPSHIFIRAEQDAVLTRWSYETHEILLKTSDDWKLFIIRIASDLFVRREEREIALLTEPAEERYKHLLSELPEILRQVPQYLVASYLGIKSQSLSRIRSQMAEPRKFT